MCLIWLKSANAIMKTQPLNSNPELSIISEIQQIAAHILNHQHLISVCIRQVYRVILRIQLLRLENHAGILATDIEQAV